SCLSDGVADDQAARSGEESLHSAGAKLYSSQTTNLLIVGRLASESLVHLEGGQVIWQLLCRPVEPSVVGLGSLAGIVRRLDAAEYLVEFLGYSLRAVVHLLAVVAGWIDEARRVVVRVEVPVETRRVVDLAEEGVLAGESSDLGIEVASLGVEEAELRIPFVAGEGEVVPGGGQFRRESEVAPGVQVIRGDQ